MTTNSDEKTIPLAEMHYAEDTTGRALTPEAETAHPAESDGGYGKPEPDPRGARAGFWWSFWGNVAALLWITAACVYTWALYGESLQALMQLSPARMAGVAVFTLSPALLFVVAGMLARQVSRNAWYAARVDLAVQHLSAPTAHSGHAVQTLSNAITGEVERINASLESALARLAAMEEVIAHHADALEQSAGDAQLRTESMLTDLRKERLRLGEVSESLDDKAALIAAAISDQSKMVAAAAELAASQANDSERRLRTSIDSLADAGQVIADKGELVAVKITDRATGLRDLSDDLKGRAEDLDAAYHKHRQRLGEAGEALRQEQEKIAAALDFHRAELDVMATTARDGADAINEATTTGADAFKTAVDAAIGKARDLAGHVRTETDHAAQEHEAALARLIAAAQEARSISDAAIVAIENQAELVADKVERTNEAAFEAARRSDEAFETRLKDAEKLTARASQVADDAAESVRRRLEAVLATARAETQTVERHIDNMTDRLGEMPVMARDRAQEAADALRRGLEGLNAAAIAAAEEAQEIDAAFQARIRQNYELLSDFMLHMGSVAGGRRTADLGLNEVPAPLPRRTRREREETDRIEAEDDTPTAKPDTDEMNEPLKGKARKTSPRAESSVGFPERGGHKPADPGWRWKELLASMPSDEDDDTSRARRRQRDDDEAL